MRLLIAIPVFNEEKYLSRVLAKVKTFHPDILVIDDGSTDNTPGVLRTTRGIRVITHPRNIGYGQSLIDAFRYGCDNGYDWVITMDCDEQHEPEMIPVFQSEIATDKWDIISGSRYMQNGNGGDVPPEDRRAINGRITKIINDLFGLGLTDSFCGFKAHRVSAMRKLQLDETGYAFPMQLWPRAARSGLRITEIPVRLIYNDPNRHFGGKLDDAEYRMQHYLGVLKAELDRPVPSVAEPICTGCTCE